MQPRTRPPRPTITMRWDAPANLNARLHILAAQLRVPVKTLLDDAVALVLRYQGAGQGIGSPPVRERPIEVEEQEHVVEEEVIEEVVEEEAVVEHHGGAR